MNEDETEEVGEPFFGFSESIITSGSSKENKTRIFVFQDAIMAFQQVLSINKVFKRGETTVSRNYKYNTFFPASVSVTKS